MRGLGIRFLITATGNQNTTLSILATIHSMFRVVFYYHNKKLYWDKVPERGNIMANTIINKTSLVNGLVYNNRFATTSISSSQIGDEDMKVWKSLIDDLHKSAYTLYAFCENNNLQAESAEVDKSAVFSALRPIMTELGDVNGHRMLANAELATLIIGYAGKRGNSDSPDLQFCLSKLRNRQKELAEYKKTNGVNPEAIQHLEDEITQLEQEKKNLLDAPDNRIKAPTRTSSNAFRLEVEHRIARAIADQQAMSWEALEERDKERKKKNKKSKKSEAPKAEQAQTESK